MEISARILNRVSLPTINRHMLGGGVLASVLLLSGLGVMVFGDPNAGQRHYVMAIDTPINHAQAPLSGHLRADNGHGQASPIVNAAGRHNEPRLGGVEDPGAAHKGVGAPTHVAANAPQPATGLSEPGPGGVLPIIAADGRRPADVYARPFSLPANAPAIALVVGGLGLKSATTQAAIDDLPPEVTLSFVPYTQDLQGWINKARAAGHEVMVELPMEPFDYPKNDPGPQTLLASVSSAENTRRLEWLLSRAWGYFAVTNYMGSKFTSSESALAPVLRQLRQRGVDFIYDGEARRSSLRTVADAEHLRWTIADRIIDTEPSASAIDDQLLHLEAIAIQNGAALGVGFSWPITMDRLGIWTKTINEKGYVLAPASAVLSIRRGSASVEKPAAHESQMVAKSGH